MRIWLTVCGLAFLAGCMPGPMDGPGEGEGEGSTEGVGEGAGEGTGETCGGGTAQFLGPPATLVSDELPLAVGNLWSIGFALPGIETAATPYASLEVLEHSDRNGYAIASIAMRFHVPVGATLTAGSQAGQNAIFADVFNGFSSNAAGALLSHFATLIDTQPIARAHLFIVNTVDGYYFTFDESALEGLPCGEGFFPLEPVAAFPGRLIFRPEDSGVPFAALDALNDAAIAIAMQFAEFDGTGIPPELLALANAFGAEFGNYDDSSSDIVNAVARFFASLALGLAESNRLSTEFAVILSSLNSGIETLSDDYATYVEDPENAPANIALLRGFAADLGAFASADPISSGLSDLSAIAASGAADLIESVLNEAFTAADEDIAAFGIALENCLAQETSSAALAEIGACIAAFEPSGAGSAAYQSIALEIFNAIAATTENVSTFEAQGDPLLPGGLADLDELAALSARMHAFFELAVGNDPDNLLAAYLLLVAGALDASIEALLASRPHLMRLFEAIEALRDSIRNYREGGLDAAAFGVLLVDVQTFFAGYAETFDDAWAVSLAEFAARLGDVVAESGAAAALP